MSRLAEAADLVRPCLAVENGTCDVNPDRTTEIVDTHPTDWSMYVTARRNHVDTRADHAKPFALSFSYADEFGAFVLVTAGDGSAAEGRYVNTASDGGDEGPNRGVGCPRSKDFSRPAAS